MLELLGSRRHLPSRFHATHAHVPLGRRVGVVVAIVLSGAAALLWFVVSAIDPQRTFGLPGEVTAPPAAIIAFAVGLAAVFALGIAITERVVADRTRLSTDARRHPLAPKMIMAATRGVYAGPVTVTVLVPAHDEQASIGAALESLINQTRPPERIIVVADNCTDDTVDIAFAFGVEVFETVGNVHKKAGGLNQALAVILDELGDNDCVMVVDADTVLDPRFLEAGARRLTNDRALMSVGGLLFGEGVGGLLGQFQRSEYIRLSREVERRHGRVFVLTGSAAMFRPAGLRAVAVERGSLLPGVRGDVFDPAALTEDLELTLALKTLGALMCSPNQCRVVTELIPTWRHLWNGRLRRQRGALENLGAYGFTPTVVRYWSQQLGLGYSVIALGTFWTFLAVTLLSTPTRAWLPFWLLVGAVFVVGRVVSVWRGGWNARILASLLLPELAYELFLDLVYIKGIIDITFARRPEWRHVAHETVPT